LLPVSRLIEREPMHRRGSGRVTAHPEATQNQTNPTQTICRSARSAKGLSTRLVDAYTLRMVEKPELTIVRDMDDYPAIARCSTCGKEMALRQRWFTSAAENLTWFGDQFRLHLAQEHSG